MFEIKIDNKEVKVLIGGDLKEICCDSALAISSIYEGICRKSKEMGELYKLAMLHYMSEESPVWNRHGSGMSVTVDISMIERMKGEMDDDD